MGKTATKERKDEKPSVLSSLEMDAAVCHVLEKIGKDEIKNRELREHLTDLTSYPVDLHILGTVDKKSVRLHVDGTMTVGAKNPKHPCSSDPDLPRMVTMLLQWLPGKQLEENLGLVEKAFSAPTDPEVNQDLLERVEKMLTRIRRKSTRPQNGPVKLLYSLSKSDRQLSA